jgi:hypothetical protein
LPGDAKEAPSGVDSPHKRRATSSTPTTFLLEKENRLTKRKPIYFLDKASLSKKLSSSIAELLSLTLRILRANALYAGVRRAR